jgi:F0F1-type ATP synthase delta subunit
MAPERADLVLPVAIVGMIDLSRLLREIEELQATLQAQVLRSGGQAVDQLPKFSLLLDRFVQENRLDLMQVADRNHAVRFLEEVKNNAPKIHLSFSADPSPQFMAKLTAWLRTNIHPTLLITVGLQPGIGAGCVVRTANKYFDLSLGKSFVKKRELLMQRLRDPEAVV